MDSNLLRIPWIPVKRLSGKKEIIAPWQITDNFQNDPIIGIESPRPDFNGALNQFFIGILQTTWAPESEKAWRKILTKPPSPQELKDSFSKLEPYFNLLGNGPRFIQDFDLTDGAEQNVSNLLIESPGGNTEKNNADLFIKRGQATRQCPHCLGTALYCMQINAPSGGVGHRTSLRGGGPLSTIILANTLWETVWANVLPKRDFEALAGDPQKTKPQDIFPWLAPCRTSEAKTGQATLPQDTNPLQMYWATPRRIRIIDQEPEQGVCEICGRMSQHLTSAYQTKNYGVNYEGAWQHPLTPYTRDKKGMPIARHPQPGGMVYRHWLGLVITDAEGNTRPAKVVQHFLNQRRFRILQKAQGSHSPRLWCFGFDMDNMKARCWYESTMPLVDIDSQHMPLLEKNISRLVRAADLAVWLLRTNLKKAWYKRPGDAKGDFSIIDQRFWQETESSFYEALEQAIQLVEESRDTEDLRREWLRLLRNKALEIFDSLSQTGHFEAVEPRRVALARLDLGKALNATSKIGKILDLTNKKTKAA